MNVCCHIYIYIYIRCRNTRLRSYLLPVTACPFFCPAKGGDGVCRVGHGVDPVNCFFVLGFGGVVFEANKSLSSDLHESFGKFGEHIQILMEPAEAETISERLAEAMSKRPGRPVERDEIDIIKVDVDGLDCHLVQALKVGEWRPKVWHVEINPLFPPGIALWPNGSTLGVATTTNQRELSSAFSRRGESDGKQAFVGCSLQALLDAVGSDYVLIHVEFENAVLLRKDISEALEPWLSSRSMVQTPNMRTFKISAGQLSAFCCVVRCIT